MVKFKNGPNDLTQIEIVLTDFGMAESDSKGGTPVFASPECFEKKNTKSDIFSFGRVILFLVLTKQQFSKWLFVPIKNMNNPAPSHIINLVVQMTLVTKRIDLNLAKIIFNQLRRNRQLSPSRSLIRSFNSIVNENLTSDYGFYINELCDLRLPIFS